MNGPFVVAQANSTSSGATPVQVIKLFKPTAGHTEIFHASFSGVVKIDFSAIANEKITLFHDSKNQSLHIIFADGSQDIIEPFFDSRGILSNLLLDMGSGQEFNGARFASQFPITEDQSVLPAAGPGGVASGADFHGPFVDGLFTGNPLDLLPPEELPGLQFTITATPLLTEDTFVPFTFGNLNGLVEEEELRFQIQPEERPIHVANGAGNEDNNDRSNNDADNLPTDNTTNIITGDFSTIAHGGVGGPLTFVANAGANGHAVFAADGVTQITSIGEKVVYELHGANEIWGVTVPEHEGESERTVFILHIDSNGQFTFTLTDQIDHPLHSHDDSSTNPLHQQGIFEETLDLDLSIAVGGHDAANNQFVLPTGTFDVGVIDDTPIVLQGAHEKVIVDENDIDTDLSHGTSPNDGNGDGSFTGSPGDNLPGPATVSGDLSGLVRVGADAVDDQNHGTFAFTTDGSKLDALETVGLKSQGHLLEYTIVDTDPNDGFQILRASTDDNRTVFELKLFSDGHFDFSLFDQVDHDPPFDQDPPGFISQDPTSGGNNFPLSDRNTDLIDNDDPNGNPRILDIDQINFGALIDFSDFDHDTVSLDGAFTISIRDDVPVLVHGASDDAIVDEDDINNFDPNFPGDHSGVQGSTGSHPHDGNSDGSVTGGPGDAATGPAFVSGSLANLVQSGADEPLTFSFINTADARDYLQDLGLQSKGGLINYDFSHPGEIIGFVNNPSGPNFTSFDANNGDREVFALTLNPDGTWTFKLFDQVDHDPPYDVNPVGFNNNDDPNFPGNTHNPDADQNTDLIDNDDPNGNPRDFDVSQINFGHIIQATDFDGDSVILDHAFTITIRDDIPTVHASATSGTTVIVDETTGLQNDDTINPGVIALFSGVSNKGTDSDMTTQYAHDSNSVVTAAITIGADEGGSAHWSLSINGGNGIDSGLMTTAGKHIFLFEQGGLIVGRFEGGAGSDPAESNDVAAFAIAIDDTGHISIAQFVSLQHPNTGSNDEDIFIGSGKISAVITVTDFDNDVATDSVDLGGKIGFSDDGPNPDFHQSSQKIIHDETPGVDGDANDVAPSAALDTLFSAVTNIIQDPDVPHPGGELAIGYAVGSGAIVTVTPNFGADGPGTVVYAIDVPGITPSSTTGVSSGLFTTDGHEIFLFEINSHLVVGRYDGSDAGTSVGTNDPAAFAINIDPNTGVITVAQYQSIKHDDRGDNDEANDNGNNANDALPDDPLTVQQTIADSALRVTVTVTDGDNDPVSQQFNIGDQIIFQDDGPTVTDTVKAGPNTTGLSLDLDETIGADHYNTGIAETESNGGPSNGNADDHALSVTVTTNLSVSNALAIGELTTTIAGGLGSLFTVNANFGADGPASSDSRVDTLSLVLSHSTAQTSLEVTALPGTALSGLNDAQRTISLVQVDATHIEGRIPGANGVLGGGDDYVAFRITLLNAGSPGSAQIQVDQFLPIDDGSDGNHYDTQKLLTLVGADTLGLKLVTVVTDGDGDPATSSATVTLISTGSSFISFDDDGPTVTGVTDGLGPNLVNNGSFEQGHSDLVGSDWSIYSSLPNPPGNPWTYGADHIPFEVQTGGVGGLAAQDGNALVELDGDTTGNGHPGQATPNANHTDATIQQVIAGTVAGQEYELTFYYSPRPGDSANNDSGLRVLWNGVEIDNIDSTNLPSGWTQITLHVIGTGVNDTLAFQGTGPEDELGAFIDNVSLRSVTILDDEDTTLNPAIEVQGGPGDDGHGVVATGQILFNAGTDGLKSIVVGGVAGLQAIWVDGSGIGHPESITQTWVPDGTGGGTLIGTSTHFLVGNPAFTLHVDNTGHYTFTLDAPLNHPAHDADGLNNGPETSYEDNLNLGFGFTITDGDNDTATGTLHINVDDDSPEFFNGGIEDATVTQLNVGVTKNLNIHFGADGQHEGNSGLAISGWPDLPGITEVLSADGKTLTATIDNTNGPGAGDDNVLYILHLNTDGTYTFTQQHGLPGIGTDHLSFNVTGVDGDGDGVSDAFSVKLDVAPPLSVSGTFSGTVEEEQLQPASATFGTFAITASGNEDTDDADNLDTDTSPGGFNNVTNVTAGVFTVTGGDLSYVFNLDPALEGTQVQKTVGSGLTSGGDPVLYHELPSGQIIGYVNEGAGGSGFDGGDRVIFSLNITAGGAYTFTLYDKVDHPTPTVAGQSVIEDFGSTGLVTDGSNYFLHPNGGSAVELSFAGAPVVVGQFGPSFGGPWTPIGAEQTASGFEVAWTVIGADKYTVWNTDSSGNYLSSVFDTASGSSATLQSLEASFQQDLNGDGSIGPPPSPTPVLESFGSTTLVTDGVNYFLHPNGGSAVELSFAGAPVVVGQFGPSSGGPWTPIGAEQTASGFEVAWSVIGADRYTVWNTDSSGNYLSSVFDVASGSSAALQSLETSFHQDLNGDGSIGLPPQSSGQPASEENIAIDLNNVVIVDDQSGNTAKLQGSITIIDDVPIISTSTSSASLTVDESFVATNATASFAASFIPLFGADGPAANGSKVYALNAIAGASGLVDTATGEAVDLSVVGGVVFGKTHTTGLTVFTVSVDGLGNVTLDQQRAVVHTPDTGPDQSTSLSAANLVTLTETIKDGDGDTASATLNIGQSLIFKDDAPSITVSATAAADALTVDETFLATNATANFADNFTSIPNFGADGAGTTSSAYVLSVLATGVDSGLIDVATGQHIFLYVNGGVVEGRVGSGGVANPAGAIDLTVSVNGSGVVTLDQIHALQHPNTNNPDDSVSPNAANLITLTRTDTIVDKDGDSSSGSASINIGTALTFKDDGPSVTASGTVPTLTVDETFLATDASASFAASFLSSFGADGAGSIAYALGVSSSGTDSGLVDTASGNHVFLFVEASQVVGREGTSAGAAQGVGPIVFTVSVDGSGNVTLDQQRAIVHTPDTGPDQSKSLTADNLVTLTATITDKDGDHTSAIQNIGTHLVFKDDAPTAVADTASVTPTDVAATVNALFILDRSGSMGSDGDANSSISIAKQAILDFASHDNVLSIRILPFSSTAGSPSIWFDLTTAAGHTALETFLDPISGSGNTNYESAIQTAQNTWTAPPNAADFTNVYFVSDGAPTVRSNDGVNDGNPGGIGDPNGLTSQEKAAWETFLANPTNDIDNAFAIGINTTVSDIDLQEVAYPNTPDETHNVIIINSADDLSTTLTNTLQGTVSGNVLLGTNNAVGGGDDDSFGADGPGYVSSLHFDSDGIGGLTVGDSTYTFNGSHLFLNGVDQGALSQVTFNTGHGGEMHFNFLTGAWTYSTPDAVLAQFHELFQYTLVDKDGDATPSTGLDITVNKANLAPTITSGATGTEAENTVNTHVVYDTNATDPDSGDTITYSLSAGGDNNFFNISPSTGEVAFKVSPDFEAPGDAGGNNVYDIIVHANDGHGHDATKAVAITVNDVNEQPSAGADQIVSAPENVAVGATIATVSGTDPDAGGGNDNANTFENLTYSITSGNASGIFAIDASGHISVAAGHQLDFETTTQHVLTVHVTDGGSPSLSDDAQVTINVTNVNEAPTVTSNAGGSTASVNVQENTTAVTTVVATDPDAGTTLHYSFVNNAGTDFAKFSIDTNSGALTFISAPNFESATDIGGTDNDNVYVVTVQASDGVNIDTQTINVTVTDVNEQPSAGVDQIVSAAENVNDTTVLATVVGTDPDLGGNNDGANTFENLTYSITSGNASGLFEINSSGQISLASGQHLDFETAQQHVLTVHVQDGPGLSDDAQVTINVTNVNELPIANNDTVITNISGSGAAIAIPDAALVFNDTDPDGQTLTISSAGSGSSGSASHAGTTTTFTDNNTNGGSFSYTAQDGGSPNLTDGATVTVDRAQAGESQLDGTSSSDILIGRASTADTLVGGAGDDVLFGDTGNDQFVLGSTAATNGHDNILDFTSGSDDIFIDTTQALTIGTAANVAAANFHSVTGIGTATETNTNSWNGGSGGNEFLYNQSTKELWYSANGSGNDRVDLAHMATGVPVAADVHTF